MVAIVEELIYSFFMPSPPISTSDEREKLLSNEPKLQSITTGEAARERARVQAYREELKSYLATHSDEELEAARQRTYVLQGYYLALEHIAKTGFSDIAFDHNPSVEELITEKSPSGTFLGSGSYGTVVELSDTLVLKKAHKPPVKDKKRRPLSKKAQQKRTEHSKKLFHREFRILSTLPPSPHIIRTHGAILNPGSRPRLLLENGGQTIATYFAAKDLPDREKSVQNVAQQCLLAIKHLFDNGRVHSDIKPNNILIADTGLVKLCDLGGAVRIGEKHVASTPGYAAPSVRSKKDGNLAKTTHDIYALGITLLEIATGYSPPAKTQSSAESHDALLAAQIDKIETLALKELITKMVTFDDESRISIKDALDHELFS